MDVTENAKNSTLVVPWFTATDADEDPSLSISIIWSKTIFSKNRNQISSKPDFDLTKYDLDFDLSNCDPGLNLTTLLHLNVTLIN